MHIRWRGMELPSSVEVDRDTLTGTYGKFIAEPFERGFGSSVGNSLRRVLLSSLEGSAITQIKVHNAQHEFTTIPGVLEDLWAIEPILNTGGYICLHDTFPEQCGDHAGPRHILDHLREVAQGAYELCELYTAPLNYGMALLRCIG